MLAFQYHWRDLQNSRKFIQDSDQQSHGFKRRIGDGCAERDELQSWTTEGILEKHLYPNSQFPRAYWVTKNRRSIPVTRDIVV